MGVKGVSQSHHRSERCEPITGAGSERIVPKRYKSVTPERLLPELLVALDLPQLSPTASSCFSLGARR
jgi:hypothetical protein